MILFIPFTSASVCLLHFTLSLSSLCFLSFAQVADYSYRASVRELVPQLRYLDDVRVEEDRLSCSSVMGEDWTILQNSIRDCSSSQSAIEEGECIYMLFWDNLLRPVNYSSVLMGHSRFFVEGTADGACPLSRPSSARRPVSSHSFVGPLLSAGSRSQTNSRPTSATRPGVLSPCGSRPGAVDSDLAAVDPETSILTHGTINSLTQQCYQEDFNCVIKKLCVFC